ncbi:XRE family transcriptional regulator [Pilimelia anulata]|uniref:XRE family transcriptional regulator n=1 Tax=Pilimelia anulata TaxID=53371 RepID=A0A8J3FBB6_9ACTN|nr:short-chain fatty acyl-CoA regulator family protein [Pilimelia anulata]GGK04027.1 XRE family transcriptional regulator [Pilimelia anulata]
MTGGKKLYAHAKLRRLRREHGLTQAELARRLDLSTSYLNQIENSQRALTGGVLLRLAEVLGVDPEYFADTDAERLGADVRAALADEASGGDIDPADAADLIREHPGAARALVALHQRYRDAAARVAALAGPADPAPGLGEPHDDVRDFFYRHHNYFDPLDAAAEELAGALALAPGRAAEALTRHLADAHGVRVVAAPADGHGIRRYDPATGVLRLAANHTDGQRAFQLATQLAFLAHGPLLTELAADPALDATGRALARIGLGSYYAGALLMPYGDFHADAERLRYDIELLAGRYGVGFETVCHRLSTLQRPHRRGVPLSFLRVDRAGNISKRQSATDFHFSRLGGTCPLWTVYEAFAAPGRILTQVAEMPDGKRYFWLARTVTHGGYGHHTPRGTFAVALGCELRHAHRLVYTDGVALDDPRAATPIGLGCRICERRDCAQRARPPAGGRLAIDENLRATVPYTVETRHPA